MSGAWQCNPQESRISGKIFPSPFAPFAPVTFPIGPRSAPASVAIANLKFSISNFQFRREICACAVLVAAARAVPIASSIPVRPSSSAGGTPPQPAGQDGCAMEGRNSIFGQFPRPPPCPPTCPPTCFLLPGEKVRMRASPKLTFPFHFRSPPCPRTLFPLPLAGEGQGEGEGEPKICLSHFSGHQSHLWRNAWILPPNSCRPSCSKCSKFL